MNVHLDSDAAANVIVPSLMVRGIGQSFIVVALGVTALNGLEKSEMGSASALFSTVRNVGGAIGIALAGQFVVEREKLKAARLGEAVTPQPIRPSGNGRSNGLRRSLIKHWTGMMRFMPAPPNRCADSIEDAGPDAAWPVAADGLQRCLSGRRTVHVAVCRRQLCPQKPKRSEVRHSRHPRREGGAVSGERHLKPTPVAAHSACSGLHARPGPMPGGRAIQRD